MFNYLEPNIKRTIINKHGEIHSRSLLDQQYQGEQSQSCIKKGMVFLGKTYDVSPYDSQRSHPSMDLGVKWDLCVLFVQTGVNCQDC